LGDDDHLPLAGFDGLNDLAAEETGIGTNRDLTDLWGDLGETGRQQGQRDRSLDGKNWQLRARGADSR